VKPAVKASGLACNFCKKLYARNKVGKVHAEQCCTCEVCGGLSGRYVGERGICAKCAAMKEYEAAVENLEHANERLKKAAARKNGAI
jgi:hypothetical protein